MSTHENPVPLQSHVNLVPVRVIVRDAQGHIVANLGKDDFQLYEDGKPQIISNFAVETLASISQQVVRTSNPDAAKASEAPPAFLPPSRFIALLFDDPHLSIQDVMQARNAALRYVDSSVTPTDRVAVYTVSGQMQMDFTDDRAKLRDALAKLQPRQVTAGLESSSTDCPPMDYYEADAIQNRNDQQTIDLATQDALECQATPSDAESEALTGQPSPTAIARAQAAVTSSALRVEEEGAQETEYAFRRLKEVIQRLAGLPGQRSIVLISPGFIYPNREQEFSEIVDRAIRSSVFINTLDARGLYTPNLGGDISQAMNDPTPAATGYRTSLRLEGQDRQTEVLRYLATDTGGYSFHGSNDLGEGLRQVAAAPEAYYYLAFAPQNLKYDGRLHSLKVTLRSKEKYSIQARRGYYAPLHGETPAEAARRDIDEALFSQEEQHGLPVALQTQYYKTDATDAKLAVLAHVDLAHVHFDKVDGRNQNDLTVVAALFDRNGNFITGTQKVVEMKLLDATLERLAHTGVTVRTSFDVKPGDYVVRLVVRDSKAALVSAENGAVEIPY
ncbi:MAG: VWA domain-containing protein [Candidatus Acidiferrales bacterium]|jgi:VWFA-related protein